MDKKQKAEILAKIEVLRSNVTSFKVHMDMDYKSCLSPVRIGYLLGCIESASEELANSTVSR